LKLAQEASRMTGANTPLGAEAAALYGLFASHADSALDFSAIIEFLRGAS
jgi:3-hydroxyisobutyrate dehydrogenase